MASGEPLFPRKKEKYIQTAEETNTRRIPLLGAGNSKEQLGRTQSIKRRKYTWVNLNYTSG